MLPYAILQTLSPLACVHLARSPLHATMAVLLILPPVSSVHIAIAVVHAARAMLQVMLPCTCGRLINLAVSPHVCNLMDSVAYTTSRLLCLYA